MLAPIETALSDVTQPLKDKVSAVFDSVCGDMTQVLVPVVRRLGHLADPLKVMGGLTAHLDTLGATLTAALRRLATQATDAAAAATTSLFDDITSAVAWPMATTEGVLAQFADTHLPAEVADVLFAALALVVDGDAARNAQALRGVARAMAADVAVAVKRTPAMVSAVPAALHQMLLGALGTLKDAGVGFGECLVAQVENLPVVAVIKGTVDVLQEQLFTRLPRLISEVCPCPRDALEGEGTLEVAPGAVRQAVGGGCRSGRGRLLSVTNDIEAGTWRQGDSGWA